MAENESLLDRQVNPDPPKSNRRKLKIIFITIVLLGLGTLVGNGVYRYYSAVNSVDQYYKDYNARIAAEQAAKMADTYGGKTPAETLRLYIEAVKNGNYELASKYFIEKNRQAELDSSKKATPEGVKKYLQSLESALVNIENSGGSYSPDKTLFGISDPVLVDFELYPNGIWKLTEI